jgi:hypothetical protein
MKDRLDGTGSIPGKTRDFYLLCSVKTGSMAQSAPYIIGTEVKQLERAANSKVKNGGAISPLSLRTGGVIHNQLSKEVAFLFTSVFTNCSIYFNQPIIAAIYSRHEQCL